MVEKQVLIQPKLKATGSFNYHIQKPTHCNRSPSSSSSTRPVTKNISVDPSMTTTHNKNNNLFMPLISDPSLPKPKILKSCIRCRKHKTKCDASDRSPHPCSSCAKKGIQCKIDYVLPPQRSDNLKNLVGQVDLIKENFTKLEGYFTRISQKLNLKIESFEEWRMKRDLESDTTMDQSEDEEEKTNYNLSKLSDGSFISINVIDDQKLLINNKIILIAEFQTKLNKLSSRLSYLHRSSLEDVSSSRSSTASITTPEEDNTITTDDNSSIASPISIQNHTKTSFDNGSQDICNLHGINNESTKFTPENLSIGGDQTWFELKFEVMDLFKNNKFLLIQLVAFFYPDTHVNQSTINSLDYSLFLSDYLNSYYQIIDNQNRASNSSTYSSFLINSIPGHRLVFHKVQLKNLIGAEIFNSEQFLKKLIQILFLNVLMFGLDEHFKILKDFIKFVEKNINSNRKKINFEKNEDLKFIDNYIKLFDGFEHQGDIRCSSSIVNNLKDLLKMNVDFINDHQDQSLFTLATSESKPTSLSKMKDSFQRFIIQWTQYLQIYESEQIGFFIDDFILEVFIINCLIFINEGYQDFNSTLLQFLTSYKINNESILDLIEFFKKKETENSVPNIQHFQYSCSQFQHIIMNLILNKKNILDLRITDIQVILENVDWKKESTDDVLKKIGVI